MHDVTPIALGAARSFVDSHTVVLLLISGVLVNISGEAAQTITIPVHSGVIRSTDKL